VEGHINVHLITTGSVRYKNQGAVADISATLARMNLSRLRLSLNIFPASRPVAL
jgi:hypothetical protein